MTTITAFTTLSIMSCPSCGGTYAISESYLTEARDKGAFKHCWTCPYCKCERGYGESSHQKEVKRLNDELALQTRWKEEAQARRVSAEAEAEHFRKSRDGMKGALRKVTVRVKNGVCPCCTRSFTNLKSHMATKHPQYSCEKVDA